MRPEACTILALSPAFTIEAPFRRGDSERASGQSSLPIRIQIKPGKMLAENFRGAIALETLSARIPARHITFGAEHVDRIVGDRIDKETKTPFALKRRVISIHGFHLPL